MTAKLDFLIGRAGTGKTQACLSAMRKKMENEPIGPALILLVPEYMTYKAERQLAASMTGQGGFLRAYVFGFRRFARQILLETGGADIPRISEIGRRLMLRNLLGRHQRENDLTIFARQAKQRGFTGNLSEAIREMKRYRLSAGVLRQAVTYMNAADSRLIGKVRELAGLADEFEAAMSGRANDAEDMMELLADRLSQADMIRGAEIWLDGFTFFNPQEMRVIASLLQCAAAVHITLPMTGQRLPGGQLELNLPENVRETGLFYRPYQTMMRIRQMQAAEMAGGNAGKDCSITLMTGNFRSKKKALTNLEQYLFQIAAVLPDATEADGLQLAEAANRRLEAEAAASDIRRLAREQGYRYRDIGILIRDEESYREILALVLQDYGIPFFQDGKRPAVHHPLAELMRSALDVVMGGWRYEPVFRCLRTGFFPLVRDDVDKLENYVLAFGIYGRKRWTQSENWDWYRRYSLEEDEQPRDNVNDVLAEIDGLRRQAADPLNVFEQNIRASSSVQDMVKAVYTLLVQLEVPLRLQEWTKLAEQEGRLADAAEHRQIWADIIALLDQLVEISGKECLSLSNFAAVLGDGLDAMQVALIPPGLDYVTVASFDQNSLENTRAVYILGANAGIMPRRSAVQGIFTDADRLHLEQALKDLAGKKGGPAPEVFHGSRERSFSEAFLLYHGFNEARDYLWISYALADAEGNGLQPSPLVQRLLALFPRVKEHFLSIPLESLGRHDFLQLAAASPALSGLAGALRGCREQGKMDPFWQDVYNWALDQPALRRPLNMALSGLFARADEGRIPPELAKALYLNGKVLRGSVTRFEKFRQCPFAHFAGYGLKLQERQEYRFRQKDLGQMLHAVLKEYGELVCREYEGRWQAVPQKRRLLICRSLVEKLAPRLQSEILMSRPDYLHLMSRIVGTALRSVNHLSAWAAVSEFQPAYFEEAFGHQGDEIRLKPLTLDRGYYLSFRGQIDRLDIHTGQPYFLLIDYKTGRAAMNLFEVYYGLRLQLLVYLLVSQQFFRQRGEERIPAGILYAFLRDPLISSPRRLSEEEIQGRLDSSLRMPGWVLADAELVKQIDPDSRYIKAVLKKDGEFDARTKKAHYVRTSEEFDLLLSYVGWLLEETGNEILEGDIRIRPYRMKEKKENNACLYCVYKEVCGFDPGIPGYEFRDLAEESEEELKRRMASQIGKESGWDELHRRSAESH